MRWIMEIATTQRKVIVVKVQWAWFRPQLGTGSRAGQHAQTVTLPDKGLGKNVQDVEAIIVQQETTERLLFHEIKDSLRQKWVSSLKHSFKKQVILLYYRLLNFLWVPPGGITGDCEWKIQEIQLISLFFLSEKKNPPYTSV